MRSGGWRVGALVVALIAAGCTSATDLVLDEAVMVDAAVVVDGTSTTSAPTTVSTTTAPTTTVPLTTAAPTSPPPRAPIVLGFAGDTTFTNGLELRDPFGQVADLTSAPDLMVVNLETAVADSNVGRPPVQKQFLFRSPPASLDLLVDAGVDVVTLANNHTLDFGADALAQTLQEIDARPLQRVGAGLDQDSAYVPLIVEVGEWTVGLVSLSRVPCDWAASGNNTRPQVAWVCPPFFDLATAAVDQAIAQSDVTVVMIHGGEEGVLCPSPFMVELEQAFAAMGVDAVINGHPHILQGITRHGETWAAHSLGNFAFPPASGITGNSAIVQLTVSEEGVALSVVPVRSNGGVLSPPSDSQREDILGQVQRVSDGLIVNPDGSVDVDPAVIGTC